MSDVKFTLTLEGMAQATASVQKLDDAWGKLGKGAGAAGGQAKAFGQELFSKLVPAFTVASLAADGIRKSFAFLKDQFTDTMGAAIEAEKVDRALESALIITGQTASGAAEHFKRYASALQRKTVYDDEAIKSAQALMIQMGLSTGEMDKATKGAIGLASVFDMDLQSAARAVAQGFEGNYKAIGMMIPAVREATTEGEKHAAMVKGLSDYYQRAETDAKTFGGRLVQIKDIYNDLQATIGGFVTKNQTVIETLSGVKEIIIWLDRNAEALSKSASVGRTFLETAIPGFAGLNDIIKAAKKSNEDYANSWKGWTASFLETRRLAIDPLPFAIVDLMTKFKLLNTEIDAMPWGRHRAEMAIAYNQIYGITTVIEGQLPAVDKLSRNYIALARAVELMFPVKISPWAKMEQDIQKYRDTAGAAIGAVDALFQQSTANRMISLDNEYQRRLAHINANIADETARAQAIEALDAEFAAKRKGPLRAVWLTGKAVAMSSAIMSIYEAKAKALAQGGFWAGPIMMAIVAALGWANVAAIAAQKMPLARGALFKKPTLLPARYEVAEAGSAEIVSPVPMMRSIVREELRIAAVAGGPQVNVYIQSLVTTTGLSDADVRRAGAQLKHEVEYQLHRVGR